MSNESENLVYAGIWLPRKLLEHIENLAKQYGLSRSAWIRSYLIRKMKEDGLWDGDSGD